MAMHTHITAAGERVEHEHNINLANAPHYHFDEDEDAREFGWTLGDEGEECTSVYYPPDADGKPDLRGVSPDCTEERTLGRVAELEALLVEAVGLLARVPAVRTHVNGCTTCADLGMDAAAYLAREPIAAIVKEQGR